MKHDVAVAILFCNKPDQTIELLESLGVFYDIYLLNNGSHKEATAIVEKWLNEHIELSTHYHHVKENIGVSGGRNQLLADIRLDKPVFSDQWVFFIDNDITIKQPNWQEILDKAIDEAGDDVDALAPQLLAKETGKVAPYLDVAIIGGEIRYKQAGIGVHSAIRGGAVCIRRSVFDRLGMYDENFFVGYEDVEFTLRAKVTGRQLRIKPLLEITLVHEHKKSNYDFDNDYLQVRYGKEQIQHSKEYLEKLYNAKVTENPVQWAQNKLLEMTSKTAPKTNETKRSVLLYAVDQGKIGGIETFNANFCKRMAKYYNVTFLCEKGDHERLQEMAKYCKVVFNKGQTIEVDTCIFSVAWGNRPIDTVKAKHYIQIIHADYEVIYKQQAWRYKKLEPVTTHIAVGQHVAKAFTRATKHKVDYVLPNLLDEEVKPKRVLRLITVTRIGKEKGFNRMLTLATKLKEANIPFIWLVYGNGEAGYERQVKQMFADLQEVVFMGVNTKPADMVADSDYLVALSDTEGFSLSTWEALQVGTPCIVTNYPSAKEQIQDGVNGYIVRLDLKDLDVQKLYNDIPKGFTFTENDTEQKWIEILGKPNDTPSEVGIDTPDVKVKVIKGYTDIVLGNKHINLGTEMVVSYARAMELQNKQLVKIIT